MGNVEDKRMKFVAGDALFTFIKVFSGCCGDLLMIYE